MTDPAGLRRPLVGIVLLSSMLVAGTSALPALGQPVVASRIQQARSGPARMAPFTIELSRSRPASSQVAVPVRVRVPRLEVDAGLVRLSLNPDGSIEVPAGGRRAGWFVDGSRPGHPGPAVIAGHVSTRRGPAVFARLGEMRPGDLIEVVRADGTEVMFVVDRVEQHAKDRFPTAEVYGPTQGPTLRLVTCGGAVDPRTGALRDNVVVFATLW